MKILVVGNGGREHALSWIIAKSPLVSKVFVAPGNAGTALEPFTKNISINLNDIASLLKFAKYERIDLTIVGPEEPLISGIVDIFREEGLQIFGPTRRAAQLEGSKTFAKNFLNRHKIPTAKYKSFTSINPALKYLRKQNIPIVIKTDGLAAGKGVIVAKTLQEAEKAVKHFLISNTNSIAENRIVIEEFLEGEEVSFIVMSDGKFILPMATSQDHKRVGDGETGLNTGGMGAYSPVPLVTDKIFKNIMNNIIRPTVKWMAEEENVYTGFLYAGLMINKIGNIKVIEFNCRLGDPETQTIVLRMKSDFVDLCVSGCKGNLNKKIIEWDNRIALGVVLASEGYPGNYRIGDEIHGLKLLKENEIKIFHAGTKLLLGDRVFTNGGRVLCVTTLGNSIIEAQKRAYSLISKIYWNGIFSRKDIGYRGIEWEKKQKISHNSFPVNYHIN